MKDNKLTIQINKPVSEVFAFTIDPKNTPRWVDFIVAEQTNEWLVKVGSIYKNQDRKGNWSEYLVTDFKQNQTFTFKKNDNNYNVRYVFIPINANTTELEYFEWVDNGELDEPFKIDALKKLKLVLES